MNTEQTNSYSNVSNAFRGLSEYAKRNYLSMTEAILNDTQLFDTAMAAYNEYALTEGLAKLYDIHNPEDVHLLFHLDNGLLNDETFIALRKSSDSHFLFGRDDKTPKPMTMEEMVRHIGQYAAEITTHALLFIGVDSYRDWVIDFVTLPISENIPLFDKIIKNDISHV